MVKRITKTDAYLHPTSKAPVVEYTVTFDDDSTENGQLTFWPGVTEAEIDFELRQHTKRLEAQKAAPALDLAAMKGKDVAL